VLVRSWNLFHGNAVPPERRAFLAELVRLAADGADVVCLQEVPVWALARLEEWSGMQAAGAVAAPPRLGPLPSSAELGRRLTERNPGLFRSAFTGQANAILVARCLRVLLHERVVLNARSYRRRLAGELGLGALARLAWSAERRVCQAVRLARPDGRHALVANLHATGFARDRRLAAAEIRRAVVFAETLAEPADLCVVAGDFNVEPGEPVFDELREWGFDGRGPGLDHVLVRGGAGELRTWPEERRRLDGRLLSDHAPVEVELA
jgi:endonuclease/exonuclease/phosphatase family metal-dependent hydrolase